MKYKTRINFADSFDVYDVAEADAPIISNVKLKDSTSLDSNITIGSAVSKMLSFTLKNAPVEVFDGQRLTLYGQLDEDMTPDVDFTEYELTDEQVLNDLFEPVNDDIPDGGIEFTSEEVAAIEESFAQDGETDTYEIPFEDETDNDFVETGDNDVYREDDISAEDVGDATEEDEDYISFGEFYITNIQVVGDEYNIQALDGFILMNSKYVPTNNVDTVENMYNDFRTQLNNLTGIETNEEEEYPDLTIIWDYDTTYREAAGYFAGLLGGYATFDRYGALDIRQYMKNNTLSIIDTDIVDLQLNSDSIVFIQGMICDTDITALTNYVKTSADAEDYWTINFTNPFMTQTILNNIYTTYYENLEYTPAKAVLDWTDGIQAGDLINIEDNWILITNQTIDFASGTTTIDSLGTTATLSEGQITDPMVRKMQRTQTNLKNSVQVAQELAQEADLMATATNQHFWNTTDGIYYLTEDTTVDTSKEYFSKSGDTYTRVTPIGTENPVTQGWYERLGAGAYVTEVSQDEFNDPESTNYHSGKNSLWNSAGMLFRNGLRRLLAIVTGNVNGVAIYDGQGNADENIIAEFTNEQMRLGTLSGNNVIIKPDDSMEMKDTFGETLFKVENKTSSGGSRVSTAILPYRNVNYSSVPYDTGTYTATLEADYEDISDITYRAWGYSEMGGGQGERPLPYFGSVTIDAYNGNEITFTFTMAERPWGRLTQLLMTYTAPMSNSRLITGAYADTDNDALFIVGNGGGDDSRHNALQLEKDGTLLLEGNLECDQVHANNLWGSQSADLTCSGRFSGLTIITGAKACTHSSTVGQETFAVSFGTTFKYLPNVQLTSRNARGNYIGDLTVAGLSTTGFNISIYSRESASHTYNISWFAIGERA